MSEALGAQDQHLQTERIKETLYNPRTKSYDVLYREFKVPNYKPVVSWFRTGDPNLLQDSLRSRLTDINIIRTKYITPILRDILTDNKHRVFLHLYISGLNKTLLEPNVPSVRDVFYQLKDLLYHNFPDRQVLVVVDPIIQNENGLKVLELILRLLTEFDFVRMRKIRLRLLWYRQEDGKFVVANKFIQQRIRDSRVNNMLAKQSFFDKEYYKMLEKYNAIISVDKGDEAVIGVRELSALGYKNEWVDEQGFKRRIIEYKDAAKKNEPITNIISGPARRCTNKCVLCPFYG